MSLLRHSGDTREREWGRRGEEEPETPSGGVKWAIDTIGREGERDEEQRGLFRDRVARSDGGGKPSWRRATEEG